MTARRSTVVRMAVGVALLLALLVSCGIGVQVFIRGLEYARVGQAAHPGMERSVMRVLPATEDVAEDTLSRCPQLEGSSQLDVLLGGGVPSPAATSPLASDPAVASARVTCFVSEGGGIATGQSFATLQRSAAQMRDGSLEEWRVDWSPFQDRSAGAASESVFWSEQDPRLWELRLVRPSSTFDGWVEVAVLMRSEG